MKSNKRQEKRRRMAAIVAIVLVIAMVISLLTPIFSQSAGAAQTSAEAAQVSNNQQSSNKEQTEIGLEKFTVDTNIGFDQQYVVGKVTPFWIGITNHGDDFDGELQIKVCSYIGATGEGDIYSLYYQPIQLQKQASKQLYLNIPTENIQKNFEVSLVDKNGTVVYRKYAAAKALDPETILIGILSERPEDLSYLSGLYFAQQSNATEEYTKTVFLEEDDFPTEKMVLENFKIIVIDDFDTNLLSQQQKQALLQWIKEGGTLLLGTGVNAQKVFNGLQEVLPLTENGVKRQTVTIAAETVTADIADVTAEGLTPYITEGDTILMSAMKLGAGNVIVHHISLSLAPATEIYHFAEYVQEGCELVSPLLMEMYSDDYDYTVGTLDYIARRFPQLKTNSIYMILFAILIYVIFIGPILYMILKKKDKRELGWVVIPVVSLCFVVLVFLLSMNSQYKNGIVNIVSVTDLTPKESISTTSIMGYAKSNQKGDIVLRAEEFMNVAVPSDSIWRNYNMERKNDYCSNKILAANATEITYFNKGSWDDNVFVLQTKTDLGGTIDSTIGIEGNYFVGSIINNTKKDFKDVVIVANERVFYIEGLQSGQSYEIKEPIENSSESGVEMNLYQEFNKAFGDLDNRQETTKRIKQGELSRQDVYRMMREKNMIQDYTNFNTTPSQLEEAKEIFVDIYAFDEETILPFSLEINGEQALENNLNLYHVTYPIDLSKTENFQLPFHMIKGLAMVDRNDYRINDYGNSIYVQEMTEIEWNFALPENTTIQEFQIRSNNAVDYFYASPQIYNVQTGNWETLKSDLYTEVSPYINTSEAGNFIRVKYFLRQEVEVLYPEIKMKGAGQYAGN